MKYLKIILLVSVVFSVSCKKDKDSPEPVDLSGTVTSISVKTPPTKLNYYAGDALDLTGLVITLNLDNDDTKDIAFSDFEENGITTSPVNGTLLTAASNNVSITHTSSGKNASQAITVLEATVTSLTIKTPPIKLDYYTEEALDLTGLVVTLNLENSTTKDVSFSDFEINGITTTPSNGSLITAATEIVTITHTISGKIANQEINNKGPKITSITIKTSPDKVSYYAGENLDLSGLVVALNFSNSTTKDIAFSDFGENGLVTSEENGLRLLDNVSVVITHSETGYTVNQDITVISSFTDSRDNQEYKLIKIGNQVWMAENLNYYPVAAGSVSFYYDNDSLAYAEIYGRLYDWTTANTVAPDGWHLPSYDEWQELFTFLGGMNNGAGEKLKEEGTTHWNTPNYATNESGFTALPAGTAYSSNHYEDIGTGGTFWSSSENASNYAYFVMLENSESNASYNWYHKFYGFSVRCVKDAE